MLTIQIAVLLVLVLISAFCSSSESVFFSLNALDVRRIGEKNAVRGENVRRVLGTPTRLLAGILIGNTIVNTIAASLGYAIADSLLPGKGEAVAIPCMTAILLLFGEVGPKRIALSYSHSLAAVYVPAVTLLMKLTAPLTMILEWVTKTVQPLLSTRRRTLSQEEFETVVDMSKEQGIINAEELGIVKAAIRLDDTRVSEVMTPRVDLIGSDVEEFADKGLEAAMNAKVNYIILYRDNFDNVEALLDVRKYLLDPAHNVDAAKVPPMYVHESCPLTRLLAQFQKERTRIALVIDEYGGTAGAITRGDILEEITGDVYEEMGKPRPVFQQAGPHRWIIDAGFSIDELNRKLMLRLGGDEADRLSGWIAAHTGRIPAPNEVIEADGCRVTVLQIRKHRVTLAQIEKVEEPA